eukprot:scaffold97159_cov75-Phaeocystis_antarctica.AAC.2
MAIAAVTTLSLRTGNPLASCSSVGLAARASARTKSPESSGGEARLQTSTRSPTVLQGLSMRQSSSGVATSGVAPSLPPPTPPSPPLGAAASCGALRSGSSVARDATGKASVGGRSITAVEIASSVPVVPSDPSTAWARASAPTAAAAVPSSLPLSPLLMQVAVPVAVAVAVALAPPST